jgi:hypothetical protein
MSSMIEALEGRQMCSVTLAPATTDTAPATTEPVITADGTTTADRVHHSEFTIVKLCDAATPK